MISVLQDNSSKFEWIDLSDPSPQELEQIAQKYGLHPSSVQDCLQPEHLPKCEEFDNNMFIISRMYDSNASQDADTIQEVTNKVAIFFADKYLITIHRYPVYFFRDIKEKAVDTGKCKDTTNLLNRIFKAVLLSYDAPAGRLAQELEDYETKVFLENKTPAILKGLYHLKRKVDVTKRMLILSKDILDTLDNPDQSTPYTRDTRDLYVKLQNVYDTLYESTNNLLNIYFSLTSQRTNEVVRVLTIFSVFFMPLTFIAGIYGMNFDFMPELRWKMGYPGVMGFMAIVTLCIYLWFKKKGWL
jgi:magnesium transporter